MAENTVTMNENGGKFDWQAERKEMSADVRQHILDPFALVAGWLRSLDLPDKSYTPDYGELSRLLSLLVMGAHNELDMYCSYGGHMHPPLDVILETELKRGGDVER